MRRAFLFKIVLGGIFSFLGFSCSTIGVGMMASPSTPEDPETGVAVLLMGLGIFLLPGAILLAFGLRARRTQHRLGQVVAMGQAAARLPLAEVATQLGVPPPQARALLLEAIHAGKLVGRFDYEAGVFLSGSATTAIREQVVSCGACGGTAKVIFSPGVATACPFCGAALRQPAAS